LGSVGNVGKAWAASPVALKFKSLGVDDEDLSELVRSIKHHARVSSASDVVRDGSKISKLTVLLDGVACSYKRLEDGRRQICSFAYPGDFCDLNRYVLPESDEAVAVQALTDCSVAVIDHADIERQLARSPKLALALWQASMLEACILRERMLNASRASALQRVAFLLCEQLARRDAVGIGGPLVLSQLDVADATGLSTVHVNRTVQTLRKMQILSSARNAIEVEDRQQLSVVADFQLNIAQLLEGWSVKIEGGEPPSRTTQILSRKETYSGRPPNPARLRIVSRPAPISTNGIGTTMSSGAGNICLRAPNRCR
jgi:CRP-like cAMP-binding protein